MMKPIILTAIFWVLQVSISLSQGNPKIDSLLSVLKTEKEDTSKVNILNNLSGQHLKSGNFNDAKIYADSAATIAKPINFHKGIAKSYNNLGHIQERQSNYPEALKYYLEAHLSKIIYVI